MIFEYTLTHVLYPYFLDSNNSCDDSSDIFPVLLMVASSKSWTDSKNEYCSFLEIICFINAINNWSSYTIKWKVKFFYISFQKLHSLVFFLIAMEIYNNQNCSLGGCGQVYFIVCFLLTVCYSGELEQEPRQKQKQEQK